MIGLKRLANILFGPFMVVRNFSLNYIARYNFGQLSAQTVCAYCINLWHMSHGINLLYALMGSCNYYLLYEQPSLVKLLLMSIHFFIGANDF